MKKFNPSKATKQHMKEQLKNKQAIVTKPRKTSKNKKRYSIEEDLKEHRLAVEKECLKFIKEKLDLIYKNANQNNECIMLEYDLENKTLTILKLDE